MTGNFKLTIIENKENLTEKWLIHKNNIKDTKFYNLSCCNWGITHNYEEIKKIFCTRENTYRNVYGKLPSDNLRKLNINEYVELSMILKENCLRYNKKQDKLIHKI
jgi:hypothetical protein